MARFQADGNTHDFKDVLMIFIIAGDKMSLLFLTRWVGRGSRSQVAGLAFLIRLHTVASSTSVKEVKGGVSIMGGAKRGSSSSSRRMVSTLLKKNSAKSVASWGADTPSGRGLILRDPVRLDTVLNSSLVFDPHAIIFSLMKVCLDESRWFL